MALKPAFRLQQNLFVLIHGGSGTPQSIRVPVQKLTAILTLAGFAFVATLCGTLLFFREIEVNRKLQERLLDLQTRENLAQAITAMPRSVANTTVTPSPPPMVLPERREKTAVVMREKASSNTPPADEAADDTVVQSNSAAAAIAAAPTVGAGIKELNADCAGEDCSVHVVMAPTSTGVAEGNLLLVLETEVPRIGGGNPTTQVRKRYFIYPGYQTVDDLDQDGLGALPSKAFTIRRALQTAANFHIGKLLRPLAVNIYLFGKDHTLLHHERKTIETEE